LFLELNKIQLNGDRESSAVPGKISETKLQKAWLNIVQQAKRPTANLITLPSLIRELQLLTNSLTTKYNSRNELITRQVIRFFHSSTVWILRFISETCVVSNSETLVLQQKVGANDYVDR